MDSQFALKKAPWSSNVGQDEVLNDDLRSGAYTGPTASDRTGNPYHDPDTRLGQSISAKKCHIAKVDPAQHTGRVHEEMSGQDMMKLYVIDTEGFWHKRSDLNARVNLSEHAVERSYLCISEMSSGSTDPPPATGQE